MDVFFILLSCEFLKIIHTYTYILSTVIFTPYLNWYFFPSLSENQTKASLLSPLSLSFLTIVTQVKRFLIIQTGNMLGSHTFHAVHQYKILLNIRFWWKTIY